MIAGQLFHTGAPVVLWTDPGGYDAYRTEKRFAPWDQAPWTPPDSGSGGATPNRYGLRFARSLPPDTLERVRGGGWTLADLQDRIDLFVIHYDVCGASRQCFKVLHDHRGLSVHFLLDLDGTIYQTLDLKERAWHAGPANDRSIGIEIANIGAYPLQPPLPLEENAGDSSMAPLRPRHGFPSEAPSLREGVGGWVPSAPPDPPFLPPPLNSWYATDPSGRTTITLPSWMGDGGIRTPNFTPRPARDDPIRGTIHGQDLVQFDLTPQQYDSLIKLTATLCTVFPNLPCDYPRDARGNLITTTLPPDRLAAYRGHIGHFHLTDNKIDPGPAFQWDLVATRARALMRP